MARISPVLGFITTAIPPLAEQAWTALLQLFLHDVLDVVVDREDDVGTLLGLAEGEALGGNAAAQGVLGNQHEARLARG